MVDIKYEKIYNNIVYIELGGNMSYIVKIKSILLTLVLLSVVCFNHNNFYAKSNIVGDFPKSYQSAINTLTAEYPNCQFVADSVPLSFSEAVSMQDDLFVKTTNKSYNSWRSMRKGCYDWNKNKFMPVGDGSYYGASREVIAYFLDPRNFLNNDDFYIFLDQSFKNSCVTISDLENFLKGTFLDGTVSNENDTYHGKTFAEIIFEAAKITNINPLIIAVNILNASGNNGNALTNGFKLKKTVVYNYFNISAFGNTANEILKNSANYAYSQGWTTQSKAIIEGACKISNDNSHLENNTFYYQNFNVFDIEGRVFQYSQDVEETVNCAKLLSKFYKDKSNIKFVFHIPVFTTIPSSVSPLPSKTDKLNNYYIDNMEGYMLTPYFNRYTYEYSMVSRGEERLYIDLPKGATLTSPKIFNLKGGSNIVELIVKSQTGYTSIYKVNILAYKKGTLSIIVGTENKIVLGDTNGDNCVSITDLANIRLHLLNMYTLENEHLICADTNCDGNITTTDLDNVRFHLLNILSLN